MIGANAARDLEAELSCVAALHTPESGIVDGHGFMLALRGDIEDAGGMIAFGTPVEAAGMPAPAPAGRFPLRRRRSRAP